jgi:hypothetical protein
MSMRIRVVAMATAVLLGTGGLALAPAASAAAPYHGIDGGGAVTDDWQDEENLGVDDYATSNATALWETVLWADGAQWQDDDGDWHPFTKSQIDGSFGPETESATQWWQEHCVRRSAGPLIPRGEVRPRRRCGGAPGPRRSDGPGAGPWRGPAAAHASAYLASAAGSRASR